METRNISTISNSVANQYYSRICPSIFSPASPRYNAMLSGGSMTTTEPLLGSTPISHNIIPLLDSNISPYPSYETPPPSDGGSPIAPRSFSPVSEAGSSDAVYEDLSTISASYTTEHVLTQGKTDYSLG